MGLAIRVKLLTITAIGVVSLVIIYGNSDRQFNFKFTRAESSISSSNAADTRINRDVEALVAIGSRVAGTPTNEKALAYLNSEYQKAGYETEVQTFTYPKFEDRGFSLKIDDNSD